MMRTPIFKVLKPGLQTTVQDLGRYGFREFGVSPSGAMDPYSLQMGNLLSWKRLRGGCTGSTVYWTSPDGFT